MSLKQTDFNYPEIVADQENFAEELLLSSLKNCDPYIFPHTIEWHRQEILKQLQGMEESAREEALTKLNEELGKFINLRIELDSERVRKNKDATKTILAKLQNQAIKINVTAHYPSHSLFQFIKKVSFESHHKDNKTEYKILI